METTLRVIRDEHRSISAVVHGLLELTRAAQDAKLRPGFAPLRAMIRYIDEFPEKLHHPKEDEYLFARLLARVPSAAELIAGLRAEHVESARLVRELERSLLFLEEGWPQGRQEFLDTAKAYADFHWKHMRREEQEVLPLAQRHLSAEDWRAIDAAFGENADPLAGVREKDFEALFTRIVNLAPAPVGLGESWTKAGA